MPGRMNGEVSARRVMPGKIHYYRICSVTETGDYKWVIGIKRALAGKAEVIRPDEVDEISAEGFWACPEQANTGPVSSCKPIPLLHQSPNPPNPSPATDDDLTVTQEMQKHPLDNDPDYQAFITSNPDIRIHCFSACTVQPVLLRRCAPGSRPESTFKFK